MNENPQIPTPEERASNYREISKLHPGNRFRLMFGMPLLPDNSQESDSANNASSLTTTSSYEYLGDFSATPPWHSVPMSCDQCRVLWTGCWDNFQCPKCGMGDLPNSEILNTLNFFKT